jgi:hypothetical protein
MCKYFLLKRQSDGSELLGETGLVTASEFRDKTLWSVSFSDSKRPSKITWPSRIELRPSLDVVANRKVRASAGNLNPVIQPVAY